MKIFLTLLLLVISALAVSGQNTFRAIIRDLETREALAGATATIGGTTRGEISDADGLVTLRNIPDGWHVIKISYLGYKEVSDTFNFPLPSDEAITILMETASEEIEEIIISSTRGSRTIDNIPTRVESISGEELEEKGNMKPGDIRMMLNESTGIHTQQTSATSYNSSIRIQGLDGRYTQLLRDGFPLYSGFSGGLSLLQVVPLDLKQVEVIKGATSTLYGGGAIAGLVNLISKTPEEENELSFLINGTSALGLDASGFFSGRSESVGTTIFASYNYGNPYDPAGTGFTAIPEFNRVTFNPKLFFYFDETSVLMAGFNGTVEDRTGGDILYIKGDGNDEHSWFENNRTGRFSTQLGFDKIIRSGLKLSVKNSFGYYDRQIRLPDYTFAGRQLSSFSEAALSYTRENSELIGGINIVTDNFNQQQPAGIAFFNYDHFTAGAFIQNILVLSKRLELESGVRLDHQDDYGFFFLPRLSVLLRMNERLSFRAGGGMGYKIPTVFTEDAERIHFRDIRPVAFDQTLPEKSVGGNFDINYKVPLSSSIFASVNALLFYTRINDPLVLEQDMAGLYQYLQPEGFLDTKGIETNIKLTYGDYKLYIGYTLADVNQHYNGVTTSYPLVARHRLNNVLMYEIEDQLKVGLEAYYFSKQALNDNSTGRDHWIFGLMVEKLWDNFSLFVNFENISNTRQTRFGPIFTGPVSDPLFSDIYAPLDGFVINGGLKLRIF